MQYRVNDESFTSAWYHVLPRSRAQIWVDRPGTQIYLFGTSVDGVFTWEATSDASAVHLPIDTPGPFSYWGTPEDQLIGGKAPEDGWFIPIGSLPSVGDKGVPFTC